MSSPCDRRPTSICLIHTGAIGDFVLAMSVVQALRRRWDDARVEVLGHTQTASLGLAGGCIDAVTSIETVPVHTLFADNGDADQPCVRTFERFDLIVNMLADEGSVFVHRLGELTQGDVLTLDPKPDVSGRHVTEVWAEALARQGFEGRLSAPTLRFAEERLRAGRRRLREAVGGEGRTALLHPGSGGRAKCWPVESFRDVARRLISNGWRVAFMIGPVELDVFGEAFGRGLSVVAPLIVEHDLVRAAAVIAGADVYIGNDAGMTHGAAAVGTSTVAIFGPTDPAVWRPLGGHVRVVRGDEPGSFEGVTVERVLDAIDSLVAANLGRRR